MGEETENVEAPNWLRELEAKREQRLKAKLGHEAGAGAPCLTCEEKCPGLDLHFWRKICKNCKCAKENHDVHDDDIYGWAQFQLLGSKPNKSRKFKLPGKKEEIILEWTPKGHNETVDKFLKTLPPELLPVRGSAAAQERKQLLQKQIPIHDIDPTLCHELTEPELLQMNEYIAHVKQSSVGIGHVVQLGLNRANKHTIGAATEPQLLAGRCPAQLSNAQVVQLHAAKLGEKLQNLSLEERKALNVPEIEQMGVKPGQIVDYNYPVYERVKSPDVYLNYERERAHSPNYAQSLRTNSPDLAAQKHLPHYAPGSLNRYNETKTPQTIANVRDLAFSTYDPQTIQNRNLPNQNTAGDVTYPTDVKLAPHDQHANQTSYPQLHHGDVTYPTDAKLANQRQINANAPHYRPANYANQLNDAQNPIYANINDVTYPTYDANAKDPRHDNAPHYQPVNYPQNSGVVTYPTDVKLAPVNYANQLNDAQNPAYAHVNDITYPTYDANTKEPRYNNAPHHQPANYPQNPAQPHPGDVTYPTDAKLAPVNYANQLNDAQNAARDNTYSNPTEQRYNNANAPHYQPSHHPNQLTIHQDTQNPTHVPIGVITDITYPTTDVKLAEQRYHDVNPPHYQPADTKNPNKHLACHRCRKKFENDAIVIEIERSGALFHASCFKCKGCNQNLADMVYFYDKESDDIYCGRDYAKIRGIPRCKACDELIFVKEYCLAENCTFHVKHFCCFECDVPLAGQNYVMEDAQPVCLPCFERIKANKCSSCFRVIKPDETGAKLNDLHFHVSDECFACKVCRKPLLGGKLLLRNQRLYCSTVCYGADQ